MPSVVLFLFRFAGKMGRKTFILNQWQIWGVVHYTIWVCVGDLEIIDVEVLYSLN